MGRRALAAEARQAAILDVRLPDPQRAFIAECATRGGMSLGRYVRLVLSGGRPRGRAAAPRALKQVVYELQSMGANFRQLATSLGDPDYLDWRNHVTVTLVRDCVRASDRAEELTPLLGSINRAGHLLNALAHHANAGDTVTEAEEADVLEVVAAALRPLEDCVWATPSPER